MKTSPFADRIEIGATLSVTTPLHVGTGRRFKDALIKARPEDAKFSLEEQPYSAEIAADGMGRPYLPGSGLKGALRALLEAALGRGEGVADPLFGSVDDEDGGRMGPLIVYGARFEKAPTNSLRPHARSKGDGKAASARTAIDPRRGTADRHKLFHADEVIPGTTFRFEALYLPAYAGAEAWEQLKALLFLFREHGLTAGRGTRAGHGRLKVEGAIVALRRELKGNGDLGKSAVPELAHDRLKQALGPRYGDLRPGVGKSYSLTLSCDGPFFVNDWSWEPDNDQKDEKEPQLKALRESDAKPILPGPSLLGAMRARARWLAELAALREDAESPFRPENVVDRLFGTRDGRGLLGIDVLSAGPTAARRKMTSVRLDRFSGGPMDGALFAVDSFVSPTFTLTLHLDRRADEALEIALASLLEDLARNGLRLGHGGNRGFGWFDVELKTPRSLQEEPRRVEAGRRDEHGPASRHESEGQQRRPEAVSQVRNARSGASPEIDPSLGVAPYRFVELADAVVAPPVAVGAIVEDSNKGWHDKPFASGFRGEIVVEWAAETPLLIGDEKDGVVAPLRLNGEKDYWIPGASFRGMIRSAAEIVGHARLEQVNRNHVFALRDFEHPYYNDVEGKFGGPKLGSAAKVEIGWLRRNGEAATIEPSRLAYVGVEELLASGYVGGQYTAEQWRLLPLETKYAAAGMRAGREINFGKTFNFGPSKPDAQGRARVIPVLGGGLRGVLVFSGPTPKPGDRQSHLEIQRLAKKVEYVALDMPDTQKPVPLTAESWRRFELVHTKQGGNERKPDGSWALLENTAASRPIPVFYTGDLIRQGKDFAFGLTRLFRVPHRFTVGDLLHRQRAHDMADSLEPYEPDFVSALFGFVHEAADVGRSAAGDETDLALKGRVAFSGARIGKTDKQDPVVDAPVETVMMSPRASFSPFYLRGKVKDWSDEKARIAGRKVYPPRFSGTAPNAALAAIRDHLDKQVTRLTPRARANSDSKSTLRLLKEGKGGELRFSSRIRLHNVTAEEVGLVLFALTHGGDPGKPCRHLIGRAKPYGAGQLRVVSARLTLEANGPEGLALLKAPDDEEKPGAHQEGFCPGDSMTTGYRGENVSHRPFLQALEKHMRDPGRAFGTEALALREFPATRAVQQFLGAADPREGAKMRAQAQDDGLYLKIADHQRLKKQTKLRRGGHAEAERPEILMPAATKSNR
jgi:CRISPR-associated protein (TIGR03986 family)